MHIYFHFSFQDLKSELSGNFEDACTACMHETAQYEALELRKAMKGAGTNERVLIEIILTRTADEVFHAHPPIIQLKRKSCTMLANILLFFLLTFAAPEDRRRIFLCLTSRFGERYFS